MTMSNSDGRSVEIDCELARDILYLAEAQAATLEIARMWEEEPEAAPMVYHLGRAAARHRRILDRILDVVRRYDLARLSGFDTIPYYRLAKELDKSPLQLLAEQGGTEE